MPYVTPEAKKALERRPPCNVGELTYLLYRECVKLEEGHLIYRHNLQSWCLDQCVAYLRKTYSPAWHHAQATGFARHAEVLGALTSARLELLRRYKVFAAGNVLDQVLADFYLEHTAPYEDQKREENGDVVVPSHV